MKFLLVAGLLSVSNLAFCQMPEFKHDFGLRINSYDAQNFELVYRFHANEKWSYTASAFFGSRQFFSSDGDYVIQDSLYQVETWQYGRQSFGLTLGAQRHLTFMKHNFYYVGASLGVGTVMYRDYFMSMLYTTDAEFDYGEGYNGPPAIGEIIETENFVVPTQSMGVNSSLCIGADVPIVDRLYLNLEVGIVSDFQSRKIDASNYNIFSSELYAAGGLRFRFGRVD